MAIIKPDERVFITGKTGSGKSELLKQVIDSFEYAVVLDNKGRFGTNRNTKQFELKGYGLCRDLDELPRYAERYKKIVYRPDPRLEEDIQVFRDEMNAFFWWIYYRENTFLGIDESTAICDKAYIPSGLNAIYSRGRELNVGCASCTQRPVNIHNNLISEAEHFYLYRTQLQSHRDKLSGFMGDIVRNQIDGHLKYHYYYFHPESMDDAVLMKPIKI